MRFINWIAGILVVIGGLNWGLVAVAEYDLVAELFAEGYGSISNASRVVYGLIGLAALWHVFALASMSGGSRSSAETTA